MKVDKPSNTNAAASSGDLKPAGPDKFRALFRRKAEELDVDLDPAKAGAGLMEKGFASPALIEQTPETAETATPSQIPELAAEMVSAVEVSNAAIEIQFDSTVFDGLSVRIEKQGAELAVQLNVHSAETAQLLTAHTPALQQAVSRHGYKSSVRVRRQPRPAGKQKK